MFVSNLGAVGKGVAGFEPCIAGLPEECLCSACFSVAGSGPTAVPFFPDGAGFGNAGLFGFGEGFVAAFGAAGDGKGRAG